MDKNKQKKIHDDIRRYIAIYGNESMQETKKGIKEWLSREDVDMYPKNAEDEDAILVDTWKQADGIINYFERKSACYLTFHHAGGIKEIYKLE